MYWTTRANNKRKTPLKIKALIPLGHHASVVSLSLSLSCFSMYSNQIKQTQVIPKCKSYTVFPSYFYRRVFVFSSLSRNGGISDRTISIILYHNQSEIKQNKFHVQFIFIFTCIHIYFHPGNVSYCRCCRDEEKKIDSLPNSLYYNSLLASRVFFSSSLSLNTRDSVFVWFCFVSIEFELDVVLRMFQIPDLLKCCFVRGDGGGNCSGGWCCFCGNNDTITFLISLSLTF